MKKKYISSVTSTGFAMCPLNIITERSRPTGVMFKTLQTLMKPIETSPFILVAHHGVHQSTSYALMSRRPSFMSKHQSYNMSMLTRPPPPNGWHAHVPAPTDLAAVRLIEWSPTSAIKNLQSLVGEQTFYMEDLYSPKFGRAAAFCGITFCSVNFNNRTQYWQKVHLWPLKDTTPTV